MAYLIGITGNIASGKSVFARRFASDFSFARCYTKFSLTKSTSVQIVATDGFLYPTSALKQAGVLHEKGAPHTHDNAYLRQVLQNLKSGKSAQVPLYSHSEYDPEGAENVQGDLILVEGVGLSQVLDLLDELIFLDTPEEVAHARYVDRWTKLGRSAEDIADKWENINLKNYNQYILPLKDAADVVTMF